MCVDRYVYAYVYICSVLYIERNKTIIRYYIAAIEIIRFNISVTDDKVRINEFCRYKFNCRSNPWKHHGIARIHI